MSRRATDQPYTPEIVKKIFENWPTIQSARDSGVLSVSVSENEYCTLEDRLAVSQFGSMTPRASRRTNTHYSIDDLASIVCDVEIAMARCLNPKTVVLLMQHFYEGYTETELADMQGCTQPAIHQRFERAFKAMADYLEASKEPVTEPAYSYEGYTHTRSFSSPASFLPPQRP